MAENKGGLSLLRTEDWLAVWLGFLILAAVIVNVWRPDMPRFRWATDAGFAASVAENKPAVEALVKDAQAKGEADLLAAATALSAAIDKGDRAAIGAGAKQVADTAKKAQDAGLKKRGTDVGKLGADAGAFVSKVFSGQNLWVSVKLGIGFLILSGVGILLMGGNIAKYIVGFPIVYVLAWLSQLIAGNSTVNYWGLEYVIFALIIGLFVSNVIGLPEWLREAVRTEYYIKTGLVILGANPGVSLVRRDPLRRAGPRVRADGDSAWLRAAVA